jgi:hypothetical protein
MSQSNNQLKIMSPTSKLQLDEQTNKQRKLCKHKTIEKRFFFINFTNIEKKFLSEFFIMMLAVIQNDDCDEGRDFLRVMGIFAKLFSNAIILAINLLVYFTFILSL